jgi:hypothetical protein
MYFNAQRVRKPGLRTTSHSRVSTFPVSQNAGRVKTASCRLTGCLSRGVHSNRTRHRSRRQVSQKKRPRFTSIIAAQELPRTRHMIATPRYRQALLVRYTNFRAASIRQRIKHGTVHFLRVLWPYWICAGRTTRCEKGLRENQKRTSPRRQARTT